MQQAQEIKEFVSKVNEIVNETPTVKSFKVEIPKGMETNFHPGQFFMVSFPDNAEVKTSRAYSISSSPLQKAYLEIALNKVGPFTTEMFKLKENGLLKFKGPYGKFYFSEEIKNDLVLIAGGTGITPLMGIMRFCSEKKLQNNITFFYSVKNPEEIIFHEEIKRLKDANHNFRYYITITRPEDHHEWEGRTGRIDFDLLKDEIQAPEDKIYFLCGSKEFVDNIISMLSQLNVKRDQIKTDVWGEYS